MREKNCNRNKNRRGFLLILCIIMMMLISGCTSDEKVDVSHVSETASLSIRDKSEETAEASGESVSSETDSDTGDSNRKSEDIKTDATGDSAISSESETTPEPSEEPAPALTPEPTEAPEPMEEPDVFEVHFIDVGQGDAILVVCNEHAMLVDGGKSKQSDKIYSYLRNHGIDHLDYIVATHPDADHIGGLAGALNYAAVDVALSPVLDNEIETFQNFKKYLGKQNLSITISEAGDTYALGNAEVQVLGPREIVHEDNNNSIVLKVIHGNNSFLLTGDAEEEEEQSILRSGADIRSTVLKVAHHGSAHASSQQWLSKVSPQIAVISCGSDNEYGHPTEQVLNRLKDMNIPVLRTDMHGDIIFQEVDGELRYGVAYDTNEDVYTPGIVPVPEEEQNEITRASTNSGSSEGTNAQTYILNTNTMKFHYPYCKSVKQMKDKNKAEFSGTRDELIARGYDPCGNCHP